MTARPSASSDPALPAGVAVPTAPADALPLADTLTDGNALLAQILPATRLVLWDAWDPTLELIRLQFGSVARPTLALAPAQSAPGSLWLENVYPADREILRALIAAPDAVRARKFADYRLIVGEGELLWVRHWLLRRSALVDGRRQLYGLIMPIPEQKHLEWECLRVSERECNRIGQELHDDLCQVLAGLTFMMHATGRRAQAAAPELGTELADLTRHFEDAANRVRAMAHGLFPAHLNHTTLREALTEFGRQTRTRFPVEVTLELPGKLPPHAPEQIIHVYRIAQEAVSNAVRHGRAATLRIVATIENKAMHLSIEDDGRGFPANSLRPEGIGLHVMQYRAHVLGGTLRCENLSPRGAAVRLAYPICHNARSFGPNPSPVRENPNLHS